MTMVEAIVLGLVQGLTEFLPISSTAHLRIIPALLKELDPTRPWNDPGAPASAVIQLGTLAAVLSYFRHEVGELTGAFVRALVRGRPLETFPARLAWLIGLGTIPIIIGGLAFEPFILTGARSLVVIAGALIGLALLLLVAECVSSRRRELTEVTARDAVIIGIAQALALIPGSSRSGTTITAGLFLGFTREAAARFSFLLSIPSVTLSGLYELYTIRHQLVGAYSVPLLVATLLAGISGYLAIEFLLRYLRTHTTYLFVVYRLVLGSLLLVLVKLGLIE
ncbi:MAG: undecaprenyl-diphosphatase UppP [Blastocatellia bacterium]|nr:undecaprenyl-diphosphatase UppP [Blastocatellia bacterium]MCS7156302.1 undecaprenyl-diphosphatase UppP [Blastocatellia bacterium]MCX7751348.1 undecaprenyl-diphosphatase UppP [Blastocatellia bacterium]MDW8169060.1 undecaprenyl-diphosphatase UppP [Acidobacteriota bacterium]MDW8256420.1 undecaprenyl-diphosphatase UppP [Acidobacteriota bacterium]